MKRETFGSKLELTNNGELALLFVGSGTAFSKKYFQTNLMVVKGQDHVLVDCGTLCPLALELKYKLNLSEIDNLLLTHPHADHIGGVEEIALTGRYVKNRRIRLFITNEFKEALWNESLRGGLQYSEYGKMYFEDYFTQIHPSLIESSPYQTFEGNIGSINIKLFRTRHVTTKVDSLEESQISYGIIFDNRILFTGDTQFNPDQLKYFCAKYPIEVIFHDCDVAGYSVGVHSTYEQLKTLPTDLKKKICLCHYSQAAEKVNAKADGFAGFAAAGTWYKF